jgi:hypothetical protein
MADTNVRGRWLVFTSLILVVLIEVLPTEGDLKYAAFMHRSLPLYVTVKIACLMTILSPLLVYIGLNGWKGIAAVKGRFVAICIIVGLHLLLDMWLVAILLFRFISGSP